MSKLKVYRWMVWNRDCPPAQNGNRQCEHVCAAKSFSEVARITGLGLYYHRTYGGVTGNKESIEVALSEPGTVFWKAENYQGKPGPKEWKKDRNTLR